MTQQSLVNYCLALFGALKMASLQYFSSLMLSFMSSIALCLFSFAGALLFSVSKSDMNLFQTCILFRIFKGCNNVIYRYASPYCNQIIKKNEKLYRHVVCMSIRWLNRRSMIVNTVVGITNFISKKHIYEEICSF